MFAHHETRAAKRQIWLLDCIQPEKFLEVFGVIAASPIRRQTGTASECATSECEVWLVLSLLFLLIIFLIILFVIILPMLDVEHFLLLSKATYKP